MCLVYTLICVKVADIKAHVQVHRSQVHRSYVPGSAGGMFSAWRVGFKSAVFFAVLYARVVAMLTLPLHFSLLPLSPLCVDHFHFASAPPTPPPAPSPRAHTPASSAFCVVLRLSSAPCVLSVLVTSEPPAMAKMCASSMSARQASCVMKTLQVHCSKDKRHYTTL